MLLSLTSDRLSSWCGAGKEGSKIELRHQRHADYTQECPRPAPGDGRALFFNWMTQSVPHVSPHLQGAYSQNSVCSSLQQYGTP